MGTLANITGAAAELLMEAHTVEESRPGLGVELGGLFDKGTARELEEEGFGDVRRECETHGVGRPACILGCPDTYRVFIINDAGTAWLDDSGKI